VGIILYTPGSQDVHGLEALPVSQDVHGLEALPVSQDVHGLEALPGSQDVHGLEAQWRFYRGCRGCICTPYCWD